MDDERFDLRDFSHISERCAAVCSLVANAVLSVLLMREKNEVMIPYSRVLLQNCFFDVVYTIVASVVEIQVELNKGVYIFVINGFLKHKPAVWHYWMIGIWNLSFSMTLIIVPIEFFFRYMLVCKKRVIKTWELMALGLVAVIFAAAIAVTVVKACMDVDDHKAAFGELMSDPLWFDNGTQGNKFFITFLALASGVDFAIYGVMIFTSIAVARSMKVSAEKMSAKTKVMQKQMNRLLITEAGSVTIIGVLPVAVSMTILLFDITFVGFGICVICMFAWVPILNPVTTILLVGPYRRAVFGNLLESKKWAKHRNSVHTISHNTGQLTPVEDVDDEVM
ncbi:7TM GPCR protein [Aphelenchoides avenae]|nr:7TM GPCR protein [Aphelenchus avenae]